MTPPDTRQQWKAGDKLTWCDERFTLHAFDPDYPRAMCESEAGRVVAINITTAKRVSSQADRQRLKRQRRAEAGMVKIEAWLDGDQMEVVDRYRDLVGMTRSEIVAQALKAYIA